MSLPSLRNLASLRTVQPLQIELPSALFSSCILYLPFLEGAGTLSKDLSGLSNDATLTLPTWAAGPIGKAIQFGATSLFTLASVPQGNLMSWSFWYKGAQTADFQNIIDNELYGNPGSFWILRQPSGDGLVFEWYTGAAQSSFTFGGAFTGADVNWTHILVTCDYTAPLITVYKNGQFLASNNPGAVTAPSGNRLWLTGFESTYPMTNCLIAEVMAFLKVLSATEAQEIYLRSSRGSY